MNLSIYFYMGGWWGETHTIFIMLRYLKIVSEDYRDRYILMPPLLPRRLTPNAPSLIHRSWLWFQKFG